MCVCDFDEGLAKFDIVFGEFQRFGALMPNLGGDSGQTGGNVQPILCPARFT